MLLDLRLPCTSGIELLMAVRAVDLMRCVPVVVVSGSNVGQCVEEAYEAGANAFVRKPLDYGESIDMYADLLSFWLSFNLLQPPA